MAGTDSNGPAFPGRPAGLDQLPPGARQMVGVPVTGVQPDVKPGGFRRLSEGGKS